MKNKKIAILFDCENINAKHVKGILHELSNIGDIIVCQAFMDFKKVNCQNWNYGILDEYTIEPIHIFSSSYKNTSDLVIIRAATELLFNPSIDTIAIVSSDSDFRDLAITIKKHGKVGIGFGESKTPIRLREAYQYFCELPIRKGVLKDDKELIKILIKAIEKKKDKTGFAHVSQIGKYLNNEKFSLISKYFGKKALGKIIKEYSEYFEIAYKNSNKDTMLVKSKEF